MIRKDIEEVVNIVAKWTSLLIAKGEDKTDILCEFDELLPTLLSQLSYEYPVLTSKVPAIEVQRWSIYWCVQPLYFFQESDEFMFSVELIANKVSLLCVQYRSLEGISIVEVNE